MNKESRHKAKKNYKKKNQSIEKTEYITGGRRGGENNK